LSLCSENSSFGVSKSDLGLPPLPKNKPEPTPFLHLSIQRARAPFSQGRARPGQQRVRGAAAGVARGSTAPWLRPGTRRRGKERER